MESDEIIRLTLVEISVHYPVHIRHVVNFIKLLTWSYMSSNVRYIQPSFVSYTICFHRNSCNFFWNGIDQMFYVGKENIVLTLQMLRYCVMCCPDEWKSYSFDDFFSPYFTTRVITLWKRRWLSPILNYPNI